MSCPAEAAKFRSPKAGEDRGQEQRPPAALSGLYDGFDLFAGRNVYADLELATLAFLGLALSAPTPRPSKVADDVSGDKTSLLSVAQQR